MIQGCGESIVCDACIAGGLGKGHPQLLEGIQHFLTGGLGCYQRDGVVPAFVSCSFEDCQELGMLLLFCL